MTKKTTSKATRGKSSAHPFGHYTATGLGIFPLFLVKIGLGRGGFKNHLKKLWMVNSPSKILDINYHGLKIRLMPDRNRIDSTIAFSSRKSEKKELEWIEKQIQATKNSIFIDIGANIGYYSLMAAKFGAKKVLAVEPSPDLFKRLEENIALNNFGDTIHPIEVGLGDKEGTFDLNICSQSEGGSSMVGDTPADKTVKIKVMTLKKVIEELKLTKIDVLKIDIEGMEDRVLFPFFEMCPKQFWPKLVIIEENKTWWEKDIYTWMLENGYHLSDNTRSNKILTLK